MSLVRLENVGKTYPLGRTRVPALVNVNLSVEEGDFLALAGPSGSGKSTLLQLMGLLDSPTTGRVLVEGADPSALSPRARARARLEKIGFVFQSFNLLPVLTARENVEYPLVLLGRPAAERRRRVEEVLGAVGLLSRGDHRPDQLSGGQRQRVAVARALVAAPRLVLADEPTASLDSATGKELLDLMKSLNRERGVAFVFASHDPEVIRRAGRVARLHDGALLSDAPAADQDAPLAAAR